LKQVIAALVDFARHNTFWQCRKAAIQGLEKVSIPGDLVVVEVAPAYFSFFWLNININHVAVGFTAMLCIFSFFFVNGVCA